MIILINTNKKVRNYKCDIYFHKKRKALFLRFSQKKSLKTNDTIVL